MTHAVAGNRFYDKQEMLDYVQRLYALVMLVPLGRTNLRGWDGPTRPTGR